MRFEIFGVTSQCVLIKCPKMIASLPFSPLQNKGAFTGTIIRKAYDKRVKNNDITAKMVTFVFFMDAKFESSTWRTL